MELGKELANTLTPIATDASRSTADLDSSTPGLSVAAQIWRELNNRARLLWPHLFFLAEAVGHERRDCLHCLRGLGAGRGNRDGHSRPGAKRQNTHD